MSAHNHIPNAVSAHLEARLAPFGGVGRESLEDIDVENSTAVAPQAGGLQKLTLLNDLKLLFAALGAGGSVVPLGDNGRTTRLLSQYAASLRDR